MTFRQGKARLTGSSFARREAQASPGRLLSFGLFGWHSGFDWTAATKLNWDLPNHAGWIAAIIIGGIAGWLAEQFMKSNMGMLMNIVLGIVGAIVANTLLGLRGGTRGLAWLPHRGVHRGLHSHRNCADV